MKKFIKIFAFICAAVAVFAFAVLSFGCNDRVYSVSTTCSIHGGYMKLPVKIKSAYTRGGSVCFKTEQTLEEIKSRVLAIKEKGATYTAELYGKNFLYIEKTTDEVNCYMVAKLDAENEYYFDCLLSSLTENSVGNHGFVTLVPFHLFDLGYEDLNIYAEYNINEGKAYKVNYGLQDFMDFYERAGVFNVSATDSEIVVSVKDDAQVYSVIFTRGAFKIDFKNDEGEIYATYHIIEASNTVNK